MTMRTLTGTLVAGAAVLLASSGVAAPEEAPPPPRPGCARLAAAGAQRGPLAPGQQEAITEALQDEYRGEAVYARALEDLGEVRPFSNVVHAEQRHAAFLEELLTSRGIPVPDNRWARAEVPGHASRQEACAAAVEFEVGNVALYDRLLATDSLPEDVRLVFEHNRMASLERHQPAFERCAGTAGGTARGAAVGGRDGRGRGRGHGRGEAQMGGGQGRGRGGCGRGRGAGPGRGRSCSGRGPTASAPAESGS
jgi:hypothetical protein